MERQRPKNRWILQLDPGEHPSAKEPRTIGDIPGPHDFIEHARSAQWMEEFNRHVRNGQYIRAYGALVMGRGTERIMTSYPIIGRNQVDARPEGNQQAIFTVAQVIYDTAKNILSDEERPKEPILQKVMRWRGIILDVAARRQERLALGGGIFSRMANAVLSDKIAADQERRNIEHQYGEPVVDDSIVDFGDGFSVDFGAANKAGIRWITAEYGEGKAPKDPLEAKVIQGDAISVFEKHVQTQIDAKLQNANAERTALGEDPLPEAPITAEKAIMKFLGITEETKESTDTDTNAGTPVPDAPDTPQPDTAPDVDIPDTQSVPDEQPAVTIEPEEETVYTADSTQSTEQPYVTNNPDFDPELLKALVERYEDIARERSGKLNNRDKFVVDGVVASVSQADTSKALSGKAKVGDPLDNLENEPGEPSDELSEEQQPVVAREETITAREQRRNNHDTPRPGNAKTK